MTSSPGSGAAGRAGLLLGTERRAVGEHGVDLPLLAVRGALHPELVLLGVDYVDVGDLNPRVVDGAALTGVLDQDQLERRLGTAMLA